MTGHPSHPDSSLLLLPHSFIQQIPTRSPQHLQALVPSCLPFPLLWCHSVREASLTSPYRAAASPLICFALWHLSPLVTQTVKNLPANAGDVGSMSRLGRFTWRRKWQPIPVFLPGKSHGQRSLIDYSPWGHKELNMTERITHTQTHTHTHAGTHMHTHTHTYTCHPNP